MKSYQEHVSVSKRKNRSRKPSNKGEEEEKEEDRRGKHAGKELYKPCLDNKEYTY